MTAAETSGRSVPFPTLDRWQRESADLIVRYYKNEISRLMHQAEHWAANGKPYAVHHRLHKADAYFQIVCLFERFSTFNENPFDEMRRTLERAKDDPAGTYPPGHDIYKYREPEFVVTKAKGGQVTEQASATQAAAT